MRIHFDSLAQPKAIAASLKRELVAHGQEVSIRTCEQHVAGMAGYANWHDLRKSTKGRNAARKTGAADDTPIDAGRDLQYVGYLAPLYGPSIATAVVGSIGQSHSLDHDVPAPEAPIASVPGPSVAMGDGEHAFAFSHYVTTEGGEIPVRSEGRLRIPSARGGIDPAFRGEFLVSMEVGRTGHALTALEIHQFEGGLYSRLQPLPSSPPSAPFMGQDELADILLWNKEPPDGAIGHPLVQAIALGRHRLTTNLAEHVAPPWWEEAPREGRLVPNPLRAAFYGNMEHCFPPSSDARPEAGAAVRGAESPAAMTTTDALLARGVRVLRDDGDRIHAEIVEAVEGQLAIVSGEVMLRTPEPCWKLTLSKFGELSLDLHVSRYLWGRDAYQPTLYFALDEDEARERAIESLLRFTGRPHVRTRGRLDHLSPGACVIDGRASSLAYLAARMREALTQAARLMPEEAAQAAETLRSLFPVDGYPSLAGFVTRGGPEATLAPGIVDGWNDLCDLTGDLIRMDSDVPALASLAGHGVLLSYLASTQLRTLELA